MFEVVPYKHDHVLPLLEQGINKPLAGFFLHGLGRQFETRGTAFTGLSAGKVLVCGGIDEIWENRGIVWTIFNEETKQNFLPVFRAFKKFLAASKFRRIEISVPYGFEQGARRARLLGFKLECECARAYLPDGTDCAIYSLVKGSN